MRGGPIKVRELNGQLTQAGRIRAGKKVTSGGRTRPEKLRNFRFTSSDRGSIEQVSKLYGGTVQPWNDPMAAPNQWEVITEADEISVALPQDPLSDTVYELWSGGGCQRRCDGETVTLAVGGGPDGSEPVERSCLCAERGELECKLTTRLSVILPEIRFLGLWRLDTKGINAAKELPGMVAGIQALQTQPGFVRAVLRLEQRVSRRPGHKPSRFVVPTLGLDNSPEEIVAGAAQLGRAQMPALDAPASCPGCASVYSTHWPDCPNRSVLADDIVPELPEALLSWDGDVVEAELVEDGPIVLTETAGQEVTLRDPENVQAWADALTTNQRAKVLMKARISQRARGLGQARTFEEIDVDLLDELMGNGTP